MSYCYACDRFVAQPIIVEHQPYCQRCASQFPDDEDGYSPVPHDAARIEAVIHADAHQVRDAIDEVTARIDAVLREDLPPWVLPEEVDAYAAEPVPLAEQIRRYGEMAEAVLDALHDNLEDPWFREWVITEGGLRIIKNYSLYGSAMYGWDVNRRDQEMVEEVADYTVMGTAGPFYDVLATRPLPVTDRDV